MPDKEGNPTDRELEVELGWEPTPASDAVETPIPAPDAVLPTPTPTAPPVDTKPAAPAAPNETAVLQEQVRTQQVQMGIARATQAYTEQLVAGGVERTEAQRTATEAAERYWAEYQQGQTLDRANEAVKQALIKDLSREHGVPTELLAGFTDPASMRAAAVLYGGQAKQIADLQGKVAPQKAPIQQFDGGAGTSGGVQQARRNDYVQGKGKALNAVEFEALHGYRPI